MENFAKYNFELCRGMVLAALGCLACQSTDYQERQVTLTVTPAPLSDRAAPSSPTGLSREKGGPSLEAIEALAKSKWLTTSDLKQITKDVPPQKSEELYQRIKGFKADRSFIEAKTARTKAFIEKSEKTPEEVTSYLERLEAIPRLVEEGNFQIANEVLYDIQQELGPADGP